jgi:radical SAM superfamily enzyme YgiQ (UPF0313 family)
MRLCVCHGIRSKANFIFGFPTETKLDVVQSIKMMAQLAIRGVDDIMMSEFSLYPGSDIFEELSNRNQVPIMDDAYFYSLLSIADLKNDISWSNHFSEKYLTVMLWIGYVTFYGLAHLLRPARLVRLARNIMTRRPETRLERAFGDMIVRLSGWRGGVVEKASRARQA